MNQSHKMDADPDSIMLSAVSLYKMIEASKEDKNQSADPLVMHGHFLAKPMIMAFAMELALKAWFILDGENQSIPRYHNLAKLFDNLKEETRDVLESAFPEIPHPVHPSFGPIRPGLRSILDSHKMMFVDWRYLHEQENTFEFQTGLFNEALATVIRQYESRQLRKHQLS